MKLKSKLCQRLMICFLAIFTLSVPVGADGAIDSIVMRRIVTSPMQTVPVITMKEEGTLLLSDSPEYPTADGILASDQMEGKCRIYFYHVNQTNVPRKIVVMAYNPTDHPVQVSLDRFQYAAPSPLYYRVGKELSLLYYESEPTVNMITVPAYDYALLGERLNTVAVQPDDLFSGILDMYLPEKMYVSSIIMPFAANPFQFVKTVKVLPGDEPHLRGTFQGMNRTLRTVLPYDYTSGMGAIYIGDGDNDKFLQGTDALNATAAENTGNYGLDYTLHIDTRGSGLIHLYFNTQGGGFAGVMEIDHDEKKKIVEIPRDSNKSDLGKDDYYGMQYLDAFYAGTKVTIRMMPPGAASLPVRLILVPDNIQKSIQETVTAEQKLAENAVTEPGFPQNNGTDEKKDQKTGKIPEKKRLLLGGYS